MVSSNDKRKHFNLNKYERQIIGITFMPAIILSIVMVIWAVLFHVNLVKMLLTSSEANAIRFINYWIVLLVFSLIAIFVILIISAYFVSKNLVGAFGRILRELDDVIDGKDIKAIGARKKDDLANDILERINIIISNLPQPRTSLKKKDV